MRTQTHNTLSDFIRANQPDQTNGYSVPFLRNIALTLNFVEPHLEICNLEPFSEVFPELSESFRFFMRNLDTLMTGETVSHQVRGMICAATVSDWGLHFHIKYTSGFSLERFTFVDHPYWTLIQHAVAEKIGMLGKPQTWELVFGDTRPRFGDLRQFYVTIGKPTGLLMGIDDWEPVYSSEVCPCAPGTIGEGLFMLFRSINVFHSDESVTSARDFWYHTWFGHHFNTSTHLYKMSVRELYKLRRGES